MISLSLLCIACGEQQPAIKPVPGTISTKQIQQKEILIAAIGDVMMPASIQKAAARNKGGYDLLFEKISKDLSEADITFANLESPVDDKAEVSGYPKFNANPDLLTSLKKAGVDIVSVANNHAMDMGSEGLKRTLDNIEAAGLFFTGAGRTKAEAGEIKYVKARDITVAFLSYTYGTNQRLPKKAADAPGVNVIGIQSEQDLNRATVSVQQARPSADLVVVSVHWGDEYATGPTAWQRRVASQLINAGADLIFGHHPHVLQPIESFTAGDGRVGLVAFSLGNFISTQHAGVTYATRDHQKALRGDGIILTVRAVKRQGSTRLVQAEFLPIWTLHDRVGNVSLYRPVSLAREISSRERVGQRDSGDDEVVKLLNHRQAHIIRRLTDVTSE